MNRKLTALVVVVLLLGPVVGPTIAAVQTVFVGGGTPIGTQSGLYIKPGSDQQLNLEDPWQNQRSIKFQNITFRGSDATATVDQFGDPATGASWTNLSSIDASNGRVYIDRPDARMIGAGQGVDKLSVRSSSLAENTENVDIVASASGNWTVVVNSTGLSQGTGFVAENAQTGDALGSGVVDANGNVVVRDLPPTTDTKINLRVGPSEIQVFEENDVNKLVTGTELRIRVFGEDDVYERQVTDGTVSLAGIPTDERLSITVQEGGDYEYRRITIPSATQQAAVYLLNSTANQDISTVNFRVDDRTGGRFSGDGTRFIVEKPITKDFDNDGNNETRYRAIAGDTIGSTGEFTSILETENRYRLRVVNGQGDERIPGAYVVQGNAAPQITIGRIVINDDNERGYAVQFEQFSQDTDGDDYNESFVRVVYDDDERRTTELRYVVTNESSGNTITDTAISGPLGQHSNTFKVSENATGATYKVDYEADRRKDDGSEALISGTRFAGDVPPIGGELPIDGKWLSLIGYVSVVAIAGLVVIYDGSMAALVATGWSSLLTVLGIISVPLPALGLAAAVSSIAIIGRVR